MEVAVIGIHPHSRGANYQRKVGVRVVVYTPSCFPVGRIEFQILQAARSAKINDILLYFRETEASLNERTPGIPLVAKVVASHKVGVGEIRLVSVGFVKLIPPCLKELVV